MKNYYFNIIITEKCNASCTHCYMSAGNGKDKSSMTKDKINCLINKLPSNTKSIVLTGGEVYTQKDLLIYFIKKIREKFDKNQTILGIESNGKLIYNSEDKVVLEMENLSKLGVNFIRFSDDEFHEAGGIDLFKVRNISKIVREHDIDIDVKYLVLNCAVPIGNAKNISSELKEKKMCMNSEETFENPYLFIDVSGDVFCCTWKCIPSIGNIFDLSWLDLEKKLYSEKERNFLVGNIKEALSQLESDKNKINKYIEEEGECMACYHIAKEIRDV